MAMDAVTVTTAATLIVAANTARHSILIGNDSTQIIYIGDSSVTTSNGIPIPAGGTFLEDSGGTTLWGGAIYGRVAATTASAHYWERTRGV